MFWSLMVHEAGLDFMFSPACLKITKLVKVSFEKAFFLNCEFTAFQSRFSSCSHWLEMLLHHMSWRHRFFNAASLLTSIITSHSNGCAQCLMWFCYNCLEWRWSRPGQSRGGDASEPPQQAQSGSSWQETQTAASCEYCNYGPSSAFYTPLCGRWLIAYLFTYTKLPIQPEKIFSRHTLLHIYALKHVSCW